MVKAQTLLSSRLFWVEAVGGGWKSRSYCSVNAECPPQARVLGLLVFGCCLVLFRKVWYFLKIEPGWRK